ncbi:hypothetical protein Unana1_07634 [Umbelopsis nana]
MLEETCRNRLQPERTSSYSRRNYGEMIHTLHFIGYSSYSPMYGIENGTVMPIMFLRLAKLTPNVEEINLERFHLHRNQDEENKLFEYQLEEATVWPFLKKLELKSCTVQHGFAGLEKALGRVECLDLQDCDGFLECFQDTSFNSLKVLITDTRSESGGMELKHIVTTCQNTLETLNIFLNSHYRLDLDSILSQLSNLNNFGIQWLDSPLQLSNFGSKVTGIELLRTDDLDTGPPQHHTGATIGEVLLTTTNLKRLYVHGAVVPPQIILQTIVQNATNLEEIYHFHGTLPNLIPPLFLAGHNLQHLYTPDILSNWISYERANQISTLCLDIMLSSCEDLKSPWVKMKSLAIFTFSDLRSDLLLLSSMFPNLENLKLGTTSEYALSFDEMEQLLSNFKRLKAVDLSECKFFSPVNSMIIANAWRYSTFEYSTFKMQQYLTFEKK